MANLKKQKLSLPSNWDSLKADIQLLQFSADEKAFDKGFEL